MLHHLHLCLLLGTTASAWTHPSVPAATETSAPKWAHGAGDTKDAASFTLLPARAGKINLMPHQDKQALHLQVAQVRLEQQSLRTESSPWAGETSAPGR